MKNILIVALNRLERLRLNLYSMFKIAIVTVSIDVVSTAIAFFFVPSLEAKEANWVIRLLWPKMGFWAFTISYADELLVVTFISAMLLFLSNEFSSHATLRLNAIVFNILAFYTLFLPVMAGLQSWWL